MNSPKWSLALVSVALTIALALGIDWFAAEWLGIGSAHARWWLLATTLILVCGSFAYVLGRELASRKKAADELDALGRGDTHRLAKTNASFRDDTQVGDNLERAVARLQGKMRSISLQTEELEKERAAYERLAKSYEAQSRQVRSVLSALGEPVLVTDKRDQLVLSNSSANRLLAIAAPTGEKKALAALVRCEELVELLHETRRKQTFTEQAHEIEVPAADGTPRWYRVTTRNIPTQPGDSDPDGTSQGAVALLHDVSAQRRLQKRNAEFVTAVSHQMKTPLATISAYTELLADGEADTPESQQQFLKVIAGQSRVLSDLVNNLVDLARIEADLAGEQRVLLSLTQLVDAAASAARPLAESKQVSLELNHDEDGLACVIDRQLMFQAVAQLVSNAIKYTPSGGRIAIRTGREQNLAWVQVTDTGIGITKEQQARVFEKFFRVLETQGMATGSGLGLPLVKHIVEDVHGGQVELKSSPGTGTQVRITLELPAAETNPSSAGQLGEDQP
jgi:two-component system phosphate regulon sensor histidine kinase PhoR